EACLALLEKALERTVYSSSAQVPDAPLKVFDSGPWIYEPDGVRFSGQQLDGAAFAEYRRLLAAAPAAPKGGIVDGAWRQRAAEWLEAKAAEQEANNQRWPDHAAAYGSWRDRPGVLRLLAMEVRAALATGEQP